MTPDKNAKLVTYLLVRRPGKAFLVQYREAPNPQRSGWWVPAPALPYGEHPDAAAQRVLASLGLPGAKPTLVAVDSFVTRDWHVLFHYVADAATDPVPGPEYAAGQWFDLDALPPATELAHGKWERDLVARLAALGPLIPG